MPSGDVTVLQLVLPKSMRCEVLQQLHNMKTSDHVGVAKTLEKDSAGSSAGKMYKSGAEIVTSVLRNEVLRKIVAPLKTVNVGAPMERIAIDVLGPLPMTEAGNKYILIIANCFTKWVEAFPLPNPNPNPNQEAKTVADKLVNKVICRFGVPLMHAHDSQ